MGCYKATSSWQYIGTAKGSDQKWRIFIVWYYGFWDELNISEDDHVALKGMSTNKDLIIQKGNSVVLLSSNDYLKPMNEILCAPSKFDKLVV